MRKFTHFLCVTTFSWSHDKNSEYTFFIQDFQQKIQAHYMRQIKLIVGALLFNYVNKFRRLFLTKRILVPRRPPRYFPADNLVTLYSLEKSYGQQLLRSLKGLVFLEVRFFDGSTRY